MGHVDRCSLIVCNVTAIGMRLAFPACLSACIAAETANSSLCWMLHYTKKKEGEDRVKYLLIKQKSQNQYCCS